MGKDDADDDAMDMDMDDKDMDMDMGDDDDDMDKMELEEEVEELMNRLTKVKDLLKIKFPTGEEVRPQQSTQNEST